MSNLCVVQLSNHSYLFTSATHDLAGGKIPKGSDRIGYFPGFDSSILNKYYYH
jgi:hypothetical protein